MKNTELSLSIFLRDKKIKQKNFILNKYPFWTEINFNSFDELDKIEFTEPSEHFFTFNNPIGACKKCNGFGVAIDIDPNLVIPNKNISLFDGAIAPWKGEKMITYKNKFIKKSNYYI